ncbi:LysR family transcriptional regulator [Myxococcus llanfairpwllgwyngyllgogerychwyrndrobwllllantysiliogogogochensis]|uniref:LysR family transcriptional regulator n=1 Tax=Myxococcus llanfairpwllgwyngyllgogerychwyrndrobwllllantysiliogogogochensis TaxID=2590453 RepID=A0A540X7U2_9BACT|nr:LysR family transcriptional regulator [Myxococcus llanfairpwllgwyngyllgogerychwyrndrobwllllantysiliogogogochensis]TQF17272.1 LysR family transcriptional regulator [Myxococcus llanfairpwllgwyngyllgogerychwyrndrobwllllantysiliogogogochensis]
MPSPLVETRHLLLLSALEEVGSLNAAARKLHLSPSALSQQLRELEDRLGGALFHRQWRRLVLTAAGQRLTEAARSVLGELTRAEAETRELLRGASGTLRVATVCLQSYRWLPELLKSFSRDWPGTEVTVVTEAGVAPAEWLLARKLDVALVAGEVRKSPRIRMEPLFRDELVALVGREHPWASSRQRQIDVRTFADQHLWLDEGALRADAPLGRALAKAGGLSPRKVTLIPMTGGLPVEMVRANLGVTVLPRWAVAPQLDDGGLRAFRIGPRGLWLDWAVATRDGETEPALTAFVAALRAHHPGPRGRQIHRR